MDKAWEFGKYKISMKDLYDRMIYCGYMEKMIIVVPDDTTNAYNPTKMEYEVRSCIIPTIKENYSVYDTKEHWACTGYSGGGFIVNYAVESWGIDLFDWFVNISGKNQFNGIEKVHFYFASSGAQDRNYSATKDSINRVNADFKDFLKIPEWGHNFPMPIYSYIRVFYYLFKEF